jgi:hypothetical protein
MDSVACTIVLPVSSILPAGTPSARSCSTASGVGAQCTSASTPTTHRLTSSGIARS